VATARRAVSLWMPVLGYMAFIFALSSLSRTPALPGGSDKGLHALLYAGLGMLVVRALAGGWNQPVGARVVIVTMLVCCVYGISDEFHQWFVPPRQVEAYDVVADTIGGTLAALGLSGWSRVGTV
jgi:VanZ family protein